MRNEKQQPSDVDERKPYQPPKLQKQRSLARLTLTSGGSSVIGTSVAPEP